MTWHEVGKWMMDNAWAFRPGTRSLADDVIQMLQGNDVKSPMLVEAEDGGIGLYWDGVGIHLSTMKPIIATWTTVDGRSLNFAARPLRWPKEVMNSLPREY